MKTQAAVLTTPDEPFRVADIELAEPDRGEVRVRMMASGLCHSDLHVLTGEAGTPLPAVLGHEGAGVVEALGPDVAHLEIGDHVVISWIPVCGHCEHCMRGLPQLCLEARRLVFGGSLADGTSRISLDGEPINHYMATSTFAAHMVVPARSAVRIPSTLPFDIASIIGCGVTTGMGAVWNATSVAPGDKVAVFGCGGVGMSAILAARAAGASVVVAIDVNAEKVQRALEFGASHAVTWSGTPQDVARAVWDAAGSGVDHAIEATGRTNVVEAAIETTRAGGTTVLVGLASETDEIRIPARSLPRYERRIVGSYYGSANPERSFAQIIEMYQSGRLPLDQLISHRIKLHDLNEGFELMRQGQTIRAVVEF